MPCGDAGALSRHVTYCLVPRDLAPELHELLRTHFADRDDVEVVVERRQRDRRDRLPRRGPGIRPAEKDRRRVRAANGRRTGERRGELVAVEPLPLPPEVRHLAERLTFVERIEPEPGAAEDTDTARLIVDFQSGNAEVFSILYMRYFDRVYNYVRLVVRDAHDAEDVTQQAFLRTLDGLETFEVRAGVPFVAWLLRVARNESLGHLRKHQRIEVEDPTELARRI